MAFFQGTFRKGATFVVVKFVRLSSTERLEPGMEVPSEEYPLKQFHLRSLFQRRSIGIKDSPWTKSMLEAAGKSYAHPETAKEEEPTTNDDPEVVETNETETNKKTESWNPFSK